MMGSLASACAITVTEMSQPNRNDIVQHSPEAMIFGLNKIFDELPY